MMQVLNMEALMGLKKGTCYDEHWVLYVSDEPLNSASEGHLSGSVS